MESFFGFLVFYAMFGLVGNLINLVILTSDTNRDGFLVSGKLEKWYCTNKRLSPEAEIVLVVLAIIFWLPLFILNLLFFLWISLKVCCKGLANIVWVITTDKIAKETKIEAKQFDEWAANVEEFIDSIPTKGA